jgi:hypothetical protein
MPAAASVERDEPVGNRLAAVTPQHECADGDNRDDDGQADEGSGLHEQDGNKRRLNNP